ncbi:MAG: 1-phosphofructokinase FruK [Phormidesmis priestleyi Ana]|uniref:1-phosphofructokinase n=1 Tax=Phormidesmis priestleyi Ana TaxID=1666911 RepID=A0A0P8DCA0_9CYAN|nr:MAG: 1-phosphofructokinase FruK [Phormidesmis priestleyi Ana]
MKRIVTVTLNPAVDQTAAVPNFCLNAVNRVAWAQAHAGGKGVNVAAFLADYFFSRSAYEINSISATGFLGFANVDTFEQLFEQKGISNHFVHLPGKTRVNIKVIDEVQDQVTDINFPGITPQARDLKTLADAIARLTLVHDWFIFSGSLPPGLAPTFYHDLIKPLKEQGKHIVLDTSGEALQHALLAKPNIIKPNLEELSAVLDQPLTDKAEIVSAARQLIDTGIETVVVSMGAKGALFVTAESALHAYAGPPKIKSTVGAGDAMVAGIVAAMSEGQTLPDCARLATAFSITALGQLGAYFPPETNWEKIAARVSISSL